MPDYRQRMLERINNLNDLSPNSEYQDIKEQLSYWNINDKENKAVFEAANAKGLL